MMEQFWKTVENLGSQYIVFQVLFTAIYFFGIVALMILAIVCVLGVITFVYNLIPRKPKKLSYLCASNIGIFKNGHCIGVFTPCNQKLFSKKLYESLGIKILEDYPKDNVFSCSIPKSIHFQYVGVKSYLSRKGQDLIKFNSLNEIDSIFDSEIGFECFQCVNTFKSLRRVDGCCVKDKEKVIHDGVEYIVDKNTNTAIAMKHLVIIGFSKSPAQIHIHDSISSDDKTFPVTEIQLPQTDKIVIHCNANSPLVNLAYEGYKVEIQKE